MLERILVPTDESPLSERAFPIAETLARAHGAEVTLAWVVLPEIWPVEEMIGVVASATYNERVQEAKREANAYLARIAERFEAAGVGVRIEILGGSASAVLPAFENSLRPDLVVMATHGRTGLARFTLGSIAETMLRQGSAPVLLVRPFAPVLSRMETALVPLDGSPLAEEALPMVEVLAGKPLRRIRLLRAIAAPEEREEATAYLDRVAAQLAPTGVEVRIIVEKENPARAIERAAAGVDLVILSTHGRGGLDRLRYGSVADRATRHLGTPTLLVRAGARIPTVDTADPREVAGEA